MRIVGATLSAASMVELDSNTAAATLDVGEENCATLILHVRNAIMPLSPGSVLAVVAYDPSAEIDLRSWCAMTGHGYLGVQDRGDHSLYYLRRRDSDGEDNRVRQLRQG
jgi:TusA-related sulfurtransferase